jgi:hypothetical protein
LLGLVEHTCNLSYLGGGGKKIMAWVPPEEKSMRPYLKNKLTAKGLEEWFRWYRTCLASLRLCVQSTTTTTKINLLTKWLTEIIHSWPAGLWKATGVPEKGKTDLYHRLVKFASLKFKSREKVEVLTLIDAHLSRIRYSLCHPFLKT